MRQYITPQWPAPDHIKAFVTTRGHGESHRPYDSFNLAMHVGDNPEHVQTNRQQLSQDLALPNEPCWLNQTHSTHLINLDINPGDPDGDASFSRTPEHVCAVMTADCLPLLVTNQQGTLVAAIHAGWRGLLTGVIKKSIVQLEQDPPALFVWLGPCIGPDAFEVDAAIREQFIQANPQFTTGFTQVNNQWHADLQQLAKIELQQLGIAAIFCSPYCTYTQDDLFYSYRREPITGRFASLIWISPT